MTRILAVALAALGFAATLTAQEEPQIKSGAANDQMLRVDQAAAPVPVIPTPQEVNWGRGTVKFDAASCRVVMQADGRVAELLPGEFTRRLEKKSGTAAPANAETRPDAMRFVFRLAAGTDEAETLHPLGSEAYVLTVDRDVVVTANAAAGLWHGMVTAVGLVRRGAAQLEVPRVRIVDYPKLKDRALLVDVGGQGFMVGPSRWDFPQWKEFVDWMVDHKLNDVWLEFIGSGRLMGNLDMDAGEWIGYPQELKSHPELVGRDRPIRRWDAGAGKVVKDTYTIPNVAHEFVRELIDYAQDRGVRCDLMIGYDYFANQLPVVLKVPANDPLDPRANRVYDDILRETVTRYSNASGVVLITIENKNVPPQMLDGIIRRTHDAEKIIHAANPRMEIGLLADYLEWRPLAEVARLKAGVAPDLALAYSPHREPQQKEWKRIYGNVWRYQLYTQYAWDHVAYIMPQQVRDETFAALADGYERVVTQAWYFDVFAVNYLALAEYAWNPTGGTVDGFWAKAMTEEFGPKAAGLMRTALEHTRFDRRFDIIARILSRPNVEAPFSFWDMYRLTRVDRLSDEMLADLETDARQSLAAARAAAPLVPASARERVEVTRISAERRLDLATSARHLLKALAAQRAGRAGEARTEMDACVADAERMNAAATGLGIEYPMAVHDEKLLERFREIRGKL